MTPLLRHLLKLPATTSLVKIEQRKGAQKIQEVYYVTEKVSPAEEVWEHEEVVEEHAEVLYEDEVAPLGETIVLLSEVDVFSTTEKMSQRDKKSELRGEISVTDTSKRKETRLTKHRVAPKTQETIVAVQEFKTDREVTMLEDKPMKEKIEEFFVRTIESPTEEVTDERRDSTSVPPLPDKRDVSKQETSVTVKKGREITIKTETKVRQQEVKEIEIIKDIPFVTDADKTKPSSMTISAEARKQTTKQEIERKALTEVTHKEPIVHDVIPEDKYSRTEEITEITVKAGEVKAIDKPTKVTPTEVKIVVEETTRKEETRIKPPVITDAKKDETSVPGKVSVKKEVTEKKQEKKPTSDDRTETKKETVVEKPKPKVEVTPKVKPKESVTDVEPKKPDVIEQETVYKKKEESKDVPPQRGDVEKKKEETCLLIEDTVQTKPSIPSKPEEKKRISPQTPSRGTERKSNTMIISILNVFI